MGGSSSGVPSRKLWFSVCAIVLALIFSLYSHEAEAKKKRDGKRLRGRPARNLKVAAGRKRGGNRFVNRDNINDQFRLRDSAFDGLFDISPFELGNGQFANNVVLVRDPRINRGQPVPFVLNSGRIEAGVVVDPRLGAKIAVDRNDEPLALTADGRFLGQVNPGARDEILLRRAGGVRDTGSIIK